MSVPATAVAGPGLAIPRSACRSTVVMRVALLLPALVSSVGLVAVTVAVFSIATVAVGFTCAVSWKVAVAPAASSPKGQLTTPAVLVHAGDAETNVVCEIGRASCRERVEISVVGVSLKKK